MREWPTALNRAIFEIRIGQMSPKDMMKCVAPHLVDIDYDASMKVYDLFEELRKLVDNDCFKDEKDYQEWYDVFKGMAESFDGIYRSRFNTLANLTYHQLILRRSANYSSMKTLNTQ